MADLRGANLLQHERSPYLLQHAANPVDWYPWGERAFAKAQQEDKPVFLSIGYSTCHWCHVMAHESFEDPGVARLLNDAFVSIKVDREERPDIDSIYMQVCQIMTRSGGWPLTIIMTPDKKPFFAATYIPRQTRFGRTGLLDLIPHIKNIWATRRADILHSAAQVIGALQELATGQGRGGMLAASVQAEAYEQLAAAFDSKNGGFGKAPKFPTPHNLRFLLRFWKRTGNASALDMATRTLLAMRRGGIYDHLGYGFHRYATDPCWRVPHFEKMLYDQALLAMAYIEAFQATGVSAFARTAREVCTYVLRDMAAPGGGFCAAEDADSSGREGLYYLWRRQELRTVLPPAEAAFVSRVYNLSAEGNYQEEATGSGTGLNILYRAASDEELAKDLKLPLDEFRQRREAACRKLLEHRGGRLRPQRDDKIMADWNGLMISALAHAALALGDPGLLQAACTALDFILKNLRTPAGRLLHCCREAQAGIPGYASDYAFVIQALLDLYEATFSVPYLKIALELNHNFIDHFWDNSAGGFYATADDSEELLVRQKEVYDGALPSANSVALLNLLRLAHFTGDFKLDEMAAQLEGAFAENIRPAPAAHTHFLLAHDFRLGPSFAVVIVGHPGAQDTGAMLQALRSGFVPNKVVLFRPAGEAHPEVTQVCGFAAGHTARGNKATAYVCAAGACQEPTTEAPRMLELLGSS